MEIYMLIRNFIKKAESISDINNIPERRRFVIIYKYPDSPHNTIYEIYSGNIYDLYVINTSTVVGNGYIIPKGMVVQYKNTYRGKVICPFVNKEYNMNAQCMFNDCSYATRIINGKDLLRFNKKELIFNNTLEHFVKNFTKTDVLSPLPTYFNVEDQAHLAHSDYQLIDFEQYIHNNPAFTLNDFRDIKTTYLYLEIHDDNLFQNKNQIFDYINPYHDDQYNNISSVLKDTVIDSFLDCYDAVIKSIFATVNIVIDTESGLFSIHKESLKLKYSFNITKEEITTEYAYLLEAISEPMESLLDAFSVDCLGEYLPIVDKIPTRITFYISPAVNKIRLSSPEYDTVHIENNMINTSEYSSSDINESSIAKECGESMYLSDYRYDDPSGL
jgi:hypothetical protein